MSLLIQSPGTCTDRTLPAMNPLWTPALLGSRLALQLTAATGMVVDGTDELTSWTDPVRNHVLTQSGGTGAMVTYDFNGTEVPRFTLDGYTKTGSIAAAGYCGFFAVLDLIDASGVQQNLIHTNSFSVYRASGGALRVVGIRASSTDFGALAAGRHMMLCYTPDGSNYRLLLDGAQSGTIQSGAVTAALTNVRLGLYDPGMVDTAIAEVGLTSGMISDAEAAKMMGYAAHTWGLTGLLADGHPYKTRAPRKLD